MTVPSNVIQLVAVPQESLYAEESIKVSLLVFEHRGSKTRNIGWDSIPVTLSSAAYVVSVGMSLRAQGSG